jgi:hypothetical protein
MTFGINISAARPLDGLEKAFWLLDQHRPTHFVVTGEIRGMTTVESWAGAMDATGRRLPQLARRIVNRGGQPAFVPVEPHGIPLLVVHGDCDRWASHVEQELHTPFDTANDPLVRARVLHEQDRAVLMLVLHHSLGDGASAVWLLRDVLRTLAGIPVVHADDLRSLEQSVDDAGWEARAIPDLFTDGTRSPPGFRPTTHSDASVVTRMLSRAASRRLRDTARSERATVHGALAAAAARAHQSLSRASDFPPRVFSPIDARRRLLGGAEHLGVHVNALTVRLDALSGSFWEDARQYSDAIGRFNSLDVLAGGIRAVREAVSPVKSPAEMAGGWAHVFGAEILLTNLGVLDVPTSYGSLTLASVWGPAVSTGIESEQTLGALGFDGRLHLVHTSFQPVDHFLDEVVGTIELALSA